LWNRHCINAGSDPDTTFHFDADPEPDPDPDLYPDPTPSFAHAGKSEEIYYYFYSNQCQSTYRVIIFNSWRAFLNYLEKCSLASHLVEMDRSGSYSVGLDPGPPK
jgi:hypothetical protein